jgi:hypothetical protein
VFPFESCELKLNPTPLIGKKIQKICVSIVDGGWPDSDLPQTLLVSGSAEPDPFFFFLQLFCCRQKAEGVG